MTATALTATTPASPEVQRLAASIDLRSATSISAFGKEVGERSAGYADDLLSKVRSGEMDEVGGKLNEIIASAQAFDLTDFDNGWARAPVVGPLVRRFAKSKERAMARFASVSTQVDRMVASVEATGERLQRRSLDFEAMYDGVRAEHDHLGLHVQAIEAKLVELDGELARLADGEQDLSAREERAVLEAAGVTLRKRAQDLAVLQHAALQTLPMVRLMQANNLALVDKFETIRRLTLPAWKRTFLMGMTLVEQRNAAQLSNDIDDATNYFMRRNAEVLHENAVSAAKANQRLVVDIETLRAVHDEVIQTLVDVRAAHVEGAQAREAAVQELQDLRARMAQGLPSQAAPEARLAVGR